MRRPIIAGLVAAAALFAPGPIPAPGAPAADAVPASVPTPPDPSTLPVDEVLDAYRAIREVPLDPERAVPVEGLLLRKEIAEFELTAGTFFPFRPVLGRVTGGLFLGEGVLRARPERGDDLGGRRRVRDVEPEGPKCLDEVVAAGGARKLGEEPEGAEDPRVVRGGRELLVSSVECR